MIKVVVITFVLLIIAGGFFLSTHEITPQIQIVEKALPSDKFLK